MLAADAEMLAAYTSERDRVQALVLDSDESTAWQVADNWLYDWRQRLSSSTRDDRRPSWLRRYWQDLDRQSSQHSRLPWRSA